MSLVWESHLSLELPDCPGVEAVRRMVATRPGVPIIALSHTEDEGLALFSVQAGASISLGRGGGNVILPVRTGLRSGKGASGAAASSATSFGMDLGETAGIIATLATTLGEDKAGTSFRAMLTSLQAPSAGAA